MSPVSLLNAPASYAIAKEMQAVIVRHLQPLAIASAMHFLVLLDSKKRTIKILFAT